MAVLTLDPIIANAICGAIVIIGELGLKVLSFSYIFSIVSNYCSSIKFEHFNVDFKQISLTKIVEGFKNIFGNKIYIGIVPNDDPYCNKHDKLTNISILALFSTPAGEGSLPGGSSNSGQGGTNPAGVQQNIAGGQQNQGILAQETQYARAFATGNQIAVRDSAVAARQLDPNVSYQPYATNLARAMERTRADHGDSRNMEDLAPNDRIFASIVMGILHPDYDPNRH